MKILTSNFTIPGTQNLTMNGFEGDTNLSNVFSNISNLKLENISFKNTARINNLFINSWPEEEYDSETGEYRREFDFSNVKFSDYLEMDFGSSLFYGYNTAIGPLNISNLNIKTNGSETYFLNVSAGWSGENYTDTYIKNCNIVGFSYFPQNIYVENSAIEFSYNEINVWNARNVKFVNACNIRTERKTDLQSYNISFENIKSFKTNGPIDANYIKNLDFSNMTSVALVNSQDTFELGDISNVNSRQFSNLNLKNISFGNTIINRSSSGDKYASGFQSAVRINNLQIIVGAQEYLYYPTFNGVFDAFNVDLDVRGKFALAQSNYLKEISFTNLKATTLEKLFAYCNNLSNNSVKNIVNAIITFDNQINATKNLMNTNIYSPFYSTKFNNSYYTEYHEALTALGWTF